MVYDVTERQLAVAVNESIVVWNSHGSACWLLTVYTVSQKNRACNIMPHNSHKNEHYEQVICGTVDRVSVVYNIPFPFRDRTVAAAL